MSITTATSVFSKLGGVGSGVLAFAAAVVPSLSFGAPNYIQSATPARSTLACGISGQSDPHRRLASGAFASNHYWAVGPVQEYAARHPGLNLTNLASLVLLIETGFSPQTISYSIQRDPDEGWEVLVMSVVTPAVDAALQNAKEDALYSYIDDNPNIHSVLRDVVISFV